MAIGVMQFIRGDFPKAADYFRNLLKSDPYNHSLWNKYGAALSQMDEEDKAIECYRIALQLRPNYVRTYVNIGMA